MKHLKRQALPSGGACLFYCYYIALTGKIFCMLKKRIILGSASPRRRDLLSGLGIEFEIISADIDETVAGGEEGDKFAERLASEKARAVALTHKKKGLYIGADTVVLLGKRIFGKPSSNDEAREMLNALSGKTHSVVTAFAITDEKGHKLYQEAVESRVTFREISKEEIENYVKSGEPSDKAGAYAIQGGADNFVELVQGSYNNIVGLPTERLSEVLKELGVEIKHA